MLVSPVREFSHEGRIYSAEDVLELPDEMAREGLRYGILVSVPDVSGSQEPVQAEEPLNDPKPAKKPAAKKKK